jgi:hypothetical protein
MSQQPRSSDAPVPSDDGTSSDSAGGRSGRRSVTDRLASRAAPKRRMSGVGRVLVVVYGILALAATGRSVYQIIDRFDSAPVAFTLSAFSAVIYIVATIALVIANRTWYRVAWVTISIELAGVLVIGTISTFAPAIIGANARDPFGDDSTVWSTYGAGYLFIPLVLPMLGMWWLSKHKPAEQAARVSSRGGTAATA